MTKEEIEKLADKWYNKHGNIYPSVIEKTAFIVGYKSADQETERLKAELSEIKTELIDSASDDHYNYIVGCNNKIKQLQSELSELKERHKRDVMEAFGDGWEKGIARPKLMCVNLEQYYKQNFEK